MPVISRALMSKARILLLDEPSFGLAPIVIDNMFEAIRGLNCDFRLTILIVEQNATLALEMCDRAYVLETGQIRMEGRGSELLHDECVMKSYPGITKQNILLQSPINGLWKNMIQ